jgi:hypothetical protein
MKRKFPGIVLALTCCGAGGAKADWEYTKWGMTPQQVVSASNSRATEGSDLRPDSDGNVSKLVAPYKIGTFLFQADFGFNAADRLSSVTLVLNDASASMDMDMDVDAEMQKGADMQMNTRKGTCQDLHLSVNTIYGPPQGGGTADMLYSIETWQDQKNKNNVKYTVLYGTGCYVQYSAIKSAGAR